MRNYATSPHTSRCYSGLSAIHYTDSSQTDYFRDLPFHITCKEYGSAPSSSDTGSKRSVRESSARSPSALLPRPIKGCTTSSSASTRRILLQFCPRACNFRAEVLVPSTPVEWYTSRIEELCGRTGSSLGTRQLPQMPVGRFFYRATFTVQTICSKVLSNSFRPGGSFSGQITTTSGTVALDCW